MRKKIEKLAVILLILTTVATYIIYNPILFKKNYQFDKEELDLLELDYYDRGELTIWELEEIITISPKPLNLPPPETKRIIETEPATTTTTTTPAPTQPTTSKITSAAAPVETTTASTTAAPTTSAAVTTTAAPVRTSGNFLFNITNPDPSYCGRVVQVEDRAVLEGLIMGEFGTSYEGAVLVAQAIRDSMVSTGNYNAGRIAREWGYTARIHSSVNDNVKRAVSYVFDQGGSAVQHSIYYFYASHLIYSSWHESQKFIIEFGGCRFFSRW